MSLKELQQQQTQFIKRISRIQECVKDGAKPMKSSEAKCRLEILEEYFRMALNIQLKIEQIDVNDTGGSQLEEMYIATKVLLQNQCSASTDHNSTTADISYITPGSSSKLPKLKLPSFGGQYSEFKNFFASFNQIIDSETSLSNIEKFNHLLNCLHGQALETVKAFQVTNENYPKALERLKSRYDNNTLIFLENIASLFQLSPMSKSSPSQLRSIVDGASALYDSLLSLGSEKDVAQAMLIYLVIDKVDGPTKKKWNESLDFKKLPTWSSCAELLERHCQYLESLHNSNVHNNEGNSGDKITKKGQRHSYSFTCSNSNCHLCESKEHNILQCAEFKNMKVCERFDKVKRLNLCINCLAKGHTWFNCSSHHKCKICSKRHHTLLHRSPTNSYSEPKTISQQTMLSSNATEFCPKGASVHTHLNNSVGEEIILATALVMVRNAFGEYKIGRALLDSCSQANFITEHFSQVLCLPRKKHNQEIYSIGHTSSQIKHSTSTTIKSRFTNFELSLPFCITSHIAYHPDKELDVSTWKIPSNIQLADEHFYKSHRIDLLLGTETFFDIISIGQIRLASNLPILQKTLFGWVVSGRYEKRCSSSNSSTFVMMTESSIDKNLQRLWKLEDLSETVSMRTREQENCELLFIDTVKRDTAGRIVVRLPFKGNPNELGSSYEIALRRFLCQERRLLRSNELQSQYVEFLDEYEKLGHMTLVKQPNLNKPHYFIPHHCVLRPSSTSTKLRVVFDASCETTSGVSLNNLLMVGPTIQPELFILLIRFRLFKFALTADIKKMYRQVLVDHKDRCFQYILWRKSPNEEICTYALNTVTYGTASAPYLAVRSLNYLADEYADIFPTGSMTIKSSFYVDDMLCGANTVQQLLKIKHEVTEILRKGGFELDKWHSNHPEFIHDTTKHINIDEGSTTSALGIKWIQNLDELVFSFELKSNSSNTSKRVILSIASSLFDPMGLIAPIIIRAKIILQELWLLKLSWDESVPQNLYSAWQTVLQDLSLLQKISIPRYCLKFSSPQNLQIHGFCDSSIRAYGACLYTRVEDDMGNVYVQLLTAKSRVAPIKKKSLPKLELCGALLLAELYAKVRCLFTNFDHMVFLWTDSQIVLHWLKCHSATLSAFVGNRVSKAQDLTINAEWRHVPTKENPADLISRGCSVAELLVSNWFNGPSFLKDTSNNWPQLKTLSFDKEEDMRERRKSAFVLSTGNNYLLQALSKYSSHIQSIRIVAWMQRFGKLASKITNPRVFGTLSADEIHNAFHCIIWNLQQVYFSEEIASLKKSQFIKSHIKHLNPFLESTNGFELLKVGGRLELANLDNSQKHPILLPNKSSFVMNYVRHLHLSNYHAGPKSLVSFMRLEYWVINAREIARKIVRSCIHCVRYKPKLLQQVMGTLPPERITPSRPFLKCGVDFCGPVNTYLRIRGKPPQKTYIAIFVCFTTKAVHIEVVSSLTSDSFLAALKRLIGRRGLPSDIFCDNATNFVGACNQLKELKEFLFKSENQHSIVKYCSNNFINFHFIPPRAPHFGGIWEAAVKSAKSLLNRSFINARLTFEELETALTGIEAILNSRPLTQSSNDPSDLEPLTPAHFLVGTSLKALPERIIEANKINIVEKWKRVSAINQQFWQRWQHEYINELQTRSKWHHSSENIKVNAMVIVHEDNVPPQHWTVGRIVSVVPGKDNHIRVVDVRTSRGIIRRPIRKIALLPI